jgi:hypothetical protein
MKTTFVLVLLLCLVPLTGFSDDSQSSGFFGGGGPMPTLLFLNLEDLNSAIIDVGYPQFNQVLFANGGGGYGGELDGLRIGGFGLGGNTLTTSGTRTASFDIAYGGMMIEKAVRSDTDFTVVLGALFGYGGLNLRFVNALPETFEDAVANPFVSSMSKDFYVVQPYIAFESKLFSWMSARFQLGFLWTLADQWTFEEAEFAGPPRTLGGLTASLILRFGSGDPFPIDEVEAVLEELVEELDTLDSSDSDSAEPAQDDAVEEAETE